MNLYNSLAFSYSISFLNSKNASLLRPIFKNISEANLANLPLNISYHYAFLLKKVARFSLVINRVKISFFVLLTGTKFVIFSLLLQTTV